MLSMQLLRDPGLQIWGLSAVALTGLGGGKRLFYHLAKVFINQRSLLRVATSWLEQITWFSEFNLLNTLIALANTRVEKKFGLSRISTISSAGSTDYQGQMGTR